jgi:hypothetical protein
MNAARSLPLTSFLLPIWQQGSSPDLINRLIVDLCSRSLCATSFKVKRVILSC